MAGPWPSIVLTEAAGNRSFIHRTPCGILTHNKHRRRHDWVVGTVHFGLAWDEARQTGGHVVLWHDGVPLNSLGPKA